jgi:lipid-binding SYLF domain-containing protein
MRKCLLLAMLAGVIAFADEKSDATERVHEATEVFGEIMAAPDKGIPLDLLERAHCIGIVPELKKGGFIVGAQYGVGIALCRGRDGSGWTGPSTIRVEGGSFGLQIGGGEIDVVFLVMNDEGARELMKSEFTLGGDASVMAGPVGRSAKAETDAHMQAKILSYSRSRGVFAGVALSGATLRSDDDANRQLYGRPVKHEDILQGREMPPAVAAQLISVLKGYSKKEKK